MRLWPLVFGAPVCVAWFILFTAFPLSAVIVLPMLIAWYDHRRRHAAFRPLQGEDDPPNTVWRG